MSYVRFTVLIILLAQYGHSCILTTQKIKICSTYTFLYLWGQETPIFTIIQKF